MKIKKVKLSENTTNFEELLQEYKSKFTHSNGFPYLHKSIFIKDPEVCWVAPRVVLGMIDNSNDGNEISDKLYNDIIRRSNDSNSLFYRILKSLIEGIECDKKLEPIVFKMSTTMTDRGIFVNNYTLIDGKHRALFVGIMLNSFVPVKILCDDKWVVKV